MDAGLIIVGLLCIILGIWVIRAAFKVRYQYHTPEIHENSSLCGCILLIIGAGLLITVGTTMWSLYN